MAPLRNPVAAACRPLELIDSCTDGLEALLCGSSSTPPIRVCSGGTTSRCAEVGHTTLDLSVSHRRFRLDPARRRVRFGCGWTMGEVQDQLAAAGQMIPTGLSGLPGSGFILTGGMGPLSRSVGLAVDHVESIQGVWGNGQPFALSSSDATPEEQMRWRALLGAGLFLAVVTDLEMRTLPSVALAISQGCTTRQALATCITAAEGCPEGLSLQWCWADQLEVMLVARCDDLKAMDRLASLGEALALEQSSHCSVAGLHQLPRFGALSLPDPCRPQPHQEVLGLLGGAWGEASEELLGSLEPLMASRPHRHCGIACQQLGGAVSRQPRWGSAFIHRQSEWKPWITAAWTADDHGQRRSALDWMERVWDVLRPHCPGVHLAQLHDHLPWHEQELTAAFGDSLPGLRLLKSRVDPRGMLPRL